MCGSYDRGSANRSFLLFTEAAGMLYAEARSVREERSRQRFALQDGAVISVSLVSGKGGWRIGSVEALAQVFMAASERSERAAIREVLLLLRRYVHGGETGGSIFQDLLELLVAKSPSQLLPLFEIRLLSALGYVSVDATLQPIISASSLSEAAEVPVADAALQHHIQTAERESQL